MARTVDKALIDIKLTGFVSLSGATLSGDNEVTHELSQNLKLTSGTTPDVEDLYGGRVTLDTGAATLDLTGLTTEEGVALTFLGKRIRAIALKAPSTNTGAITLTSDVADGLDFLGADYVISVQPGGCIVAYVDPSTKTDAVAADKDTISFAGTGSEYVDILLIAG